MPNRAAPVELWRRVQSTEALADQRIFARLLDPRLGRERDRRRARGKHAEAGRPATGPVDDGAVRDAA